MIIPRCRVPRVAAAALLAVAGISLLPAGSGASPDPVSDARQVVARATSAREQAEARLAAVTSRRVGLAERAALLDGADATATAGLTEAHRRVRQLAVAAYIDGGRTEMLQASLDPDEAAAVSWRVGIVTGGAGKVSEAMDTYERLRAENDPEQTSVAAELDRATAEEAEARSDVVQTSALERDAGVALQRATARRAAERVAEREGASPSAPQRRSPTTNPPADRRGTPSTSSAAGLGTAPRAGGPTAEEAAFLARVRACESHGNYSIVSASGRYRGAYQFSVQTWRGVGGSGDPAAASPAEQDARALALLRLQGKRAWPVCSRR